MFLKLFAGLALVAGLSLSALAGLAGSSCREERASTNEATSRNVPEEPRLLASAASKATAARRRYEQGSCMPAPRCLPASPSPLPPSAPRVPPTQFSPGKGNYIRPAHSFQQQQPESAPFGLGVEIISA